MPHRSSYAVTAHPLSLGSLNTALTWMGENIGLAMSFNPYSSMAYSGSMTYSGSLAVINELNGYNVTLLA